MSDEEQKIKKTWCLSVFVAKGGGIASPYFPTAFAIASPINSSTLVISPAS